MKRRFISLSEVSGEYGQLYLAANASLTLTGESGIKRHFHAGEVFPATGIATDGQHAIFIANGDYYAVKCEDFDACQFRYDQAWHFTPRCVMGSRKERNNHTSWLLEDDELFFTFPDLCKKYENSPKRKTIINDYRSARAAIREEIWVASYLRQYKTGKAKVYLLPKLQEEVEKAIVKAGEISRDKFAVMAWIERRNKEIQDGNRLLRMFLNRGGKFRVTWEGDTATVTPYYPRRYAVIENGNLYQIDDGVKTFVKAM